MIHLVRNPRLSWEETTQLRWSRSGSASKRSRRVGTGSLRCLMPCVYIGNLGGCRSMRQLWVVCSLSSRGNWTWLGPRFSMHYAILQYRNRRLQKKKPSINQQLCLALRPSHGVQHISPIWLGVGGLYLVKRFWLRIFVIATLKFDYIVILQPRD